MSQTLIWSGGRKLEDGNLVLRWSPGRCGHWEALPRKDFPAAVPLCQDGASTYLVSPALQIRALGVRLAHEQECSHRISVEPKGPQSMLKVSFLSAIGQAPEIQVWTSRKAI